MLLTIHDEEFNTNHAIEIPDGLTCEAAAKALHEGLAKICREVYDQKPEIEMWMRNPLESVTSGWKGAGANWWVGWESGPYQWAMSATMGNDFTGQPWFLETYWGFDCIFVEK